MDCTLDIVAKFGEGSRATCISNGLNNDEHAINHSVVQETTNYVCQGCQGATELVNLSHAAVDSYCKVSDTRQLESLAHSSTGLFIRPVQAEDCIRNLPDSRPTYAVSVSDLHASSVAQQDEVHSSEQKRREPRARAVAKRTKRLAKYHRWHAQAGRQRERKDGQPQGELSLVVPGPKHLAALAQHQIGLCDDTPRPRSPSKAPRQGQQQDARDQRTG